MQVTSALEAAQALLAYLGLTTYGEVTVQVAAGEVKLIRRGQTFLPAELARLTEPGTAGPPHG